MKLTIEFDTDAETSHEDIEFALSETLGWIRNSSARKGQLENLDRERIGRWEMNE